MIRSAPPCGPNRAGHQNGLRDEEEDEQGDLEDEVDASHLEKFMRDRRRARSLPELLDGGRKRVKFADSMGLSLARIKHFSAQEDPQIPPKVLSRYQSSPPQQQDPRAGPDPPRLLACFPEPRDAERRVRELRVCLERLAVTRFELRGQVRVLRGSAVREVGVRLTYNDWLSYVDAQAVPVPEQPGSEAVRFGFTVFTPPCMDPGAAVHFAVFLRSDEGEFWDNNQGQNYSLRYRNHNQNQPGRPDPEPAGEASPSL
ncbi:protein phosphatase 1 regulatory subunit 3G [Gambusia affinis]|uniref:protein phosphatase 1 regulatory subunit 3G n=1 Tax=Gambusia affinis TaxID=33528 RepID=UPI001CDD5616|nr:protein phosphatase 1 regulatory subunit 3G [Gambusia affinis]